MKKILIGGLTIGAVVAPIASTVACGSSSTTIQTDKIINDGANIFADNYGKNSTYADFKKTVDTQNDGQTASSDFLAQTKNEFAETLYNKEQVASIDYQIAFLKWDIYTKEKDQINRVKDLAALTYGNGATASQIDFSGTNTGGSWISIKDALKMTTAPTDSSSIFTFVNNMTETTDNKSKLKDFKDKFDEIKKIQDKLADLEKIDKNNISSWSGWSSSTLGTDYPKLLKPISKQTEEIKKYFEEKRTAAIEKYKTKAEGVEAWASEMASSYGGATSEDEAIKYLLINGDGTVTGIKTTAFSKFTYSLNNSYTAEQMLAKDATGKHIFPWFDGYDVTSAVGDKNSKAPDPASPIYVWTNDASGLIDSKDATMQKLITVDTSNLINWANQDEKITTSLSKNIFFLSRDTHSANQIIVKPHDEGGVLPKGGSNDPILITHSLIGAKQGTAYNLPWTVTKDSMKNLLEFTGDPEITKAHIGIDLFSKLYKDDALTDLFNQYVSDDTGSKINNGELGIQTYKQYAKKGGMNDGFALASMVAYSKLKNTSLSSKLGNAIDTTNGETKITELKTKILNKMPQYVLSDFIVEGNGSADQNSLSIVEAIENTGDTFKSTLSTTDVNEKINNWLESLTDDEIKTMFGSIFKETFSNRPVAYALDPKSSGIASNRFMLASPDSGVHIIEIVADSVDWQNKFEEDMKHNAKEDNISSPKIDWKTIYGNVFTDNEIISNLLQIDDKGVAQPTEYATLLKEIPSKNKALFDKWVKAGYVTNSGDPVADGKAIIESIAKSINASKINANSKEARDALTDRINTYLIGQMDNKYMDDTIDPSTLYDVLYDSLLS